MDTKSHENHLNAFFFKDFGTSYIPQILKEIYIDKIYQPFFVGKREAVVVDVGANIGLTSFYFKDFASVVHSLEPAKQHYECMVDMIAQNKIPNIKPAKVALSNVNGKTKFYHSSNTTVFSLESVINDTKEFEEVETVTLDSFCEKEKIDHIDFLKLDTKGHEGAILSSEGFEKMAPKIRAMIMEWHTWGSQSLPNTIHRLADLGFEVRRIPNEATILSAVRL